MKNPVHTVVEEIEHARHYLNQRGLLTKLRDEDLLVVVGFGAYDAIRRDADAALRATLERDEPLKVYGVELRVSGDARDDEIAVCHVLRRAKVMP